MKSRDMRYKRRLDLPADATSSGWGKIEIPADENKLDNASYFVYGNDIKLHAAIVSDEAIATRILRFSVVPDDQLRACQILKPGSEGSVDWEDLSLLTWLGRRPNRYQPQEGVIHYQKLKPLPKS